MHAAGSSSVISDSKLNGGLSRLHSADEDAVSWLTSYGSWNAYEKKKKKWFKQRLTLSVSEPSISQHSQSKEDTVEPSGPAQDFNLKAYRYTDINLTQVIPALNPDLVSHCSHLVSEMTYNVSSGTLNPTIPYHCSQAAHTVMLPLASPGPGRPTWRSFTGQKVKQYSEQLSEDNDSQMSRLSVEALCVINIWNTALLVTAWKTWHVWQYKNCVKHIR